MMNLLAITGSLRKDSFNTQLLRAVKELAPAEMTIEIVTLHGVPLYDGDEEDKHGVPASVKALQEKVKQADGVIISTPEYNFSFPGVLKNGLDWMSRSGNPFKWKRVGVMGASEGAIGTARSQYHLRQNLVGLEAITMPKPEIFVALAPKKFAEGKLTDEATRKLIATWLTAFKDWVKRG
jgi:chromate reductase, NAD(P)H dehydrogenase (quinone)